MSVALPPLDVAAPIRYKALSVFPLFARPDGKVEYRLSSDALADESILIEEISDSGSVPELLVENKGDVRVLFLEGEELIGAKQNRILNTSVLVAPKTKVKIPVSCVERGRWGYASKYFGSSGSHSPSKLRRKLKASVSHSAKLYGGHQSDQGEVWSEVACLQASHGVASSTEAMSDVYTAHQESINEYKERLKYVENAIGAAIAIGDRVVAIDVFDKPGTCEKVWQRMLSGVVFDALETGETEKLAEIADVQQVLHTASESTWEQAPAVGEGEEYRAESSKGDHSSLLVFDGAIVHGSVMPA